MTLFLGYNYSENTSLTKVKPEHIVVTSGGGSALGALMRSICDERDSVLLVCPIWDGLGLYLLIHGNIEWINVTVPWLEIGPQRSLVEELERAYLNHPNPDRIKAVVFTNPNNPLGRCFAPSVLRECLAFCAEKALHCISDEVYALSSFSSSAPFPRFTSILSLLDDTLPATFASRVHVIWSASKDFGCNGLRLGCIISQANDTLRLGSGLTSYLEVSSLTTVMTIALLDSPHLPLLIAKSSERLTAAYNLLTRGFERLHIKFIPANYGLCVFFRLVDNCSSAKEETAAVHELAQLGLVVSQGQNYALGDGVWGWARIIFAYPPDVIQRALDVLEKFRRGRGGCI
ncbi:hypothetical protein AN4153.2 [Aspergillus nidulans FGSC A4]|uniref:Aminotransferase class I/classII large domain-containing protein n=1 Tax=Emericella nidulans (strain FGSC A4 / ATCC 38163 / CBS 112.46 / NRRL 194 / M139) TaxID=227321 RepID=Q5B5M7_EMENI|nr:hypothetical protein [Aspergillus nidulans FGSC A4]EAA59414.1 hypothetical protein AN4153.2 [Aspergillus nidulans FGSC A4]CBF74597.1 TPA: conserved hypothetical protein [Aspergillus nidulans FGSC A4]|eukprot:XP_661757.1 hypothetical protein AN4153.2 [Aspergillus nidulans FGSC A4]